MRKNVAKKQPAILQKNSFCVELWRAACNLDKSKSFEHVSLCISLRFRSIQEQPFLETPLKTAFFYTWTRLFTEFYLRHHNIGRNNKNTRV